jgi:tetraacyldisaccharide 4'-kinase
MLNERKLQAIWYDGVQPARWLRALTPIYAVLVRLRRKLYASGWLRSERLPVPVIVVGNITVGGTGKTPLVIALVEALRACGWKPGVISRGYAGAGKNFLQVDERSDPLMVGDEARLIFDSTQAPVAIGRDRVAAGRELLRSASVDVLIADDGLQHYKLCRDVEICVIDGTRRFGNGLLLPAGPLREPVARLDTVAFRICNGGTPGAGEVAMTLAGDMAVALRSQRRRSLRDFAGQRVHAVAGIGNPGRFFAQLRAAGLEVVEHPFDDHFAFAATSLDFGDELPVLMTEKDAVKCRAFAGSNRWYVPVRAQLPEAFLDAVAVKIRDRS